MALSSQASRAAQARVTAMGDDEFCRTFVRMFGSFERHLPDDRDLWIALKIRALKENQEAMLTERTKRVG